MSDTTNPRVEPFAKQVTDLVNESMKLRGQARTLGMLEYFLADALSRCSDSDAGEVFEMFRGCNSDLDRRARVEGAA